MKPPTTQVKVAFVTPVTSSIPLPQLVPSAACFRCDVCCRFPEADSLLRPYFTEREITAAVAQGVAPDRFPDAAGSQVRVVTHPNGDGFLCPAFDPATAHCRIYEARPLDCRLYPLALMWSDARDQILLGWDTKCPFMRETLPADIRRHAEAVSVWLASEEIVATIARHPRLVGPFQDDVVIVKELPALTARLAAPRPDPRLRPLALVDKPLFERALARAGRVEARSLAAYAFAYQYIWTALLPYWWIEEDDTFYLFAQSSDGFFLALPPLGPGPPTPHVRNAFDLMRRWNGSSPVSRIENVMGVQKDELVRAGFRCPPKHPDYIYRADALAALSGDAYKSQRALCNRLERDHAVRLDPFRAEDRDACIALYERWAVQKRRGGLDRMGQLLLEDAEAAHRLVFSDNERLGLTGSVARVGGELRAYTFGYWLTPETYCVLLEVADRSIPGLAQWLFRETSRTAADRGARWINAMDDAGLPGLREAKRAYRPAAMIENWLVTEA